MDLDLEKDNGEETGPADDDKTKDLEERLS